jgi:hypothetical protein
MFSDPRQIWVIQHSEHSNDAPISQGPNGGNGGSLRHVGGLDDPTSHSRIAAIMSLPYAEALGEP